MPNAADYGRNTSPPNWSLRALTNAMPSESKEARYLFPHAFMDVVFAFDDFLFADTNEFCCSCTETTDLTGYTVATDAGSTAFAPAAVIGGAIQGATQGAANDYIAILTAAQFNGDQNAGQAMRWKTSEGCASSEWTQGFTDALCDDTLSILCDIDTPALGNGAADVAAFAMDTAQTLATVAFITDGSTACMNTTATTVSGCFTPTDDQWLWTSIQLIGNASQGAIFSNTNVLQDVVNHGANTACQLEGGTALTARLVYGTLACAVKTICIDGWGFWMDRPS